MASLSRLRTLGVKVYENPNDVPYVRDDSWGSFKGSYGTVYRATGRSTAQLVGQGNIYAIKEIHAVSSKDQQKVALEIKLLRQFRHENILNLEEAYTIDTQGYRMSYIICLVTKPWAPVSLDLFVRDLVSNSGQSTNCPWFEPQKLDPWPSIVRQCLSGLEYLHSQGPGPVRHGDIKPHNILLSFEAQGSKKLEVRPIITDFGISKEHIDGGTTANTGTYEYKAPEQIKKQKPTLASDVFSLGCCFALIVGVLSPWPGLETVYNAAMDTDTCQFANNSDLVNSTLLDLHNRPTNSDGRTLWHFCTHFRDLVRQMLEKKPTNRPSAGVALGLTNKLLSELNVLFEAPRLVEVDHSQGQWKEAESLEVQVIETKKMLGQQHPDTLAIMNSLALVYRNHGRLSEAESLLVQLMEIRKIVMGEEHPVTLANMNDLALTYYDEGRLQEARALWVLVMGTSAKALGVEHSDTLVSMNNLALTYYSLGQWAEAEKLEVHVMETRKSVLGGEHPSTLTSMANLASTYRNQARWKEAKELEVQVMETRKRVFGEEHPSTLTSMANLASTYRNQGRWKEAEELEVQVMETRKRVLGEEHPSTLTSMANLAVTYQNQGRWKEAEELEVQVMETRKRVLGKERPDKLVSIANLAATYRNQGRWKEAEELEVQVMETRKRVLGEEHFDTLTSMANLAVTYQNQGRWKEAEELEVQVMETKKRVLC